MDNICIVYIGLWRLKPDIYSSLSRHGGMVAGQTSLMYSNVLSVKTTPGVSSPTIPPCCQSCVYVCSHRLTLFVGVGFGLMFLSSLVVVGFYFERRRGVAATLAMCGSSIGMAVMAPVTHWFLMEYKLSGTMVLFGGIVLHGAVLGKSYYLDSVPCDGEGITLFVDNVKHASFI